MHALVRSLCLAALAVASPLRRHKEKPFFFYYSMHHVHGPIQRTPDTAGGTTSAASLYEDNIRYMDKQVGAVVEELEKLGLREKTLVIFTGDSGTALTFPSTVGGRMINGKKGTMLEGGSRVPFIASWPCTTPAGKVCKDIVSFADPHGPARRIVPARILTNAPAGGQSPSAGSARHALLPAV